ncbi:hypothetical protein ACFLR0_02175 [Candidatus Bipolaricaulota bacterium]
MHRHRTGVSIVLLAVLLSFSAATISATPSAHGAVWGKVPGFPNEPDIQLTFNVKDAGPDLEDDRGTVSGRLFDPETGKLAAVLVSTRVFNVGVEPDGLIYFVATLRLVTGTFPTPQRTIQFTAHDGGAIDQFWVGPFEVEIKRATIVARIP